MVEPLTRVEAQERTEEIRAFAAELKRLEASRVVTLTDEQHQNIRAHHELMLAALSQRFDVDRDTRSKQLSLGMRIASLLGAIALAASDLRLLLTAGLLCIMAFIAARVGEFGGLYWLDFGNRPENFLPAALAIFVVPLFLTQSRHAGFAQTYRLLGLIALFLPMLVLSHWGDGSYLSLDAETIERLYQVLGFLSTGAAIWLGIRAHWPEVVNTSVTFFIVFLYTKFYDWWWELMPKYLFFLVLGLTALLTLFVLRRLRSEARA
jgi:hypothetical protein